MIGDARGALTELNDLIRVLPKKLKFEAGSKIEFPGRIAPSADSNPNAVTDLSTTSERVYAPAELLVGMTRTGSVTFADMPKLAGKLRFAQMYVFG